MGRLTNLTIGVAAGATVAAAATALGGKPEALSPQLENNYARAGFSGKVDSFDTTSSTRLGCFGDGNPVTVRPKDGTGLMLCFSSDPNGAIGVQDAAATQDQITTDGTTESSCTGVALGKGEAFDVVPNYRLLAARGIGWTGLFCDGRLTGPDGRLYYPACTVDSDCTGLSAGSNCDRTNQAGTCMHLHAIDNTAVLTTVNSWE